MQRGIIAHLQSRPESVNNSAEGITGLFADSKGGSGIQPVNSWIGTLDTLDPSVSHAPGRRTHRPRCQQPNAKYRRGCPLSITDWYTGRVVERTRTCAKEDFGAIHRLSLHAGNVSSVFCSVSEGTSAVVLGAVTQTLFLTGDTPSRFAHASVPSRGVFQA